MDFNDIIRLVGKVRQPSGEPHKFPAAPASPLYAQHCLINEYLAELPDPANYKLKPTSFPAGRRIVEAPEQEQIALIEAMMRHRAWIEDKGFPNPNCGWTLRN